MLHRFSFALVLSASSLVSAQQAPKPGPEHDWLKEMVGTWDGVGKVEGHEVKGVMTYRMDLSGMWLVSEYKSEFGPNMVFLGRGFDGYDPVKKKYISVWFDNMSTRPMITEGELDAKTGELSMVGPGPAPDGSETKYKVVTKRNGADSMTVSLSMLMEGKFNHMVTVEYKRRK